MHIAIFVDYPDSSLGGVQTSVRAQRKALERAGHAVTMVTPPAKNGASPDQNTIFVPAFPYSPYEYPLVVPSSRRERWIIKELTKRPPIDVIHVQSNTGIGIMGIHIAKKLNLPLFQTMHTRDDVFIQKTVKFPLLVTAPAFFVHTVLLNAPPTVVYRLGESLSIYNSWRVMVHHADQADMVTAPSHHFAERLKAHGLTKPIEVVSNGLDDDMLQELWATVPDTTMSHTGLSIAWVGRLSAEKRPMVMLEAIKDLPDVTVDFYGDGPDAAAMLRYMSEHQLEGRVKLKGRVPQTEVIRAIAEHDMFVQSSYGFDSQSMVILESIAAGVPVVLSDPDLAESLPEGSGLVTETPDADGLKRAIQDLIAHPDKLAAMRSVMYENRHAVAQSYMTERMVGLYERFIRDR